jgi:hypothetical protein
MKKQATKADSDKVHGEKRSPPLEAEDEYSKADEHA